MCDEGVCDEGMCDEAVCALCFLSGVLVFTEIRIPKPPLGKNYDFEIMLYHLHPKCLFKCVAIT